MSEVEIAFQNYWNSAQPLVAIRKETGVGIPDARLVIAFKKEVEKAFHEAWRQRDNLAFQ